MIGMSQQRDLRVANPRNGTSLYTRKTLYMILMFICRPLKSQRFLRHQWSCSEKLLAVSGVPFIKGGNNAPLLLKFGIPNMGG